MFDDDDDDNDTQSRYPSIPSLVALQLMKNRLQLANLGKKLMKWSSMATGKELRKRAVEMNREFEHYGDQVANAYLLLARARFYNPDMNKAVLQNVGRNAACMVDFENRTLIGVRFFHMILIEKNHDPNLHLGLEKGGEAIAAAKQAWRDLLKEMILMLEYETAFQRIYLANKSSTKKQNVLGKVIIPKIVNAIAYIKSELEEKEREETFRLKRFKYSKAKKVEREDRARKLRKGLQEPETIIEEPEIIEELETIEEPKKVEEPEKIKEVENIKEIDILAELDIFEGSEVVEQPEKFNEPEKIEPKVMMLQITTSKQKVIEPKTIALEIEPENSISEVDVSAMFSDTAVLEVKVAEVVPEVKLQEPDIILPEFIIQGEPSLLEKHKTFMPEIIFEGKPTKVAKNWDKFVKTTPYEDMSETASTKQLMESAESCPLCKAQTNDTNQRVLHLIEHVNQFLMLCKQNKIDFTKLETKGDKFNYRNIKKELERLSFSYSCPHKSSEERNKGDIGKISCLIQRPDRSYICDGSKRTIGKEQESIYKCLSRQSSAMFYTCKQTQIDDMTSNGSVTTFIPTNCTFSFHSKATVEAKYFEYCNWTPELTLQYEKNQNHIYPSTSARSEEDNYGTQTSTHLCRCPSGECSLSSKENQSPKPSNNSPYFKKSPTYYTSMPLTHYKLRNRKLMPYLSKKNTSNYKFFTNLLQNTLPMVLYAPESRSRSYKISDMIFSSDWTNVIIPREFAAVATYQRSNLFSPYTEELYDSYDISDAFNSVESSNTVIRNDSLTCMTVLPQGYPGVVPYMSRFGFADVINNNPTNVPVLKEYAKVNDRQFCKSLVPYAPEGRPGPSGLSDDVSSLFFIANDSTSCSSVDTASISGISDTEINEDCVTCIVSQKNENSEIDTQNKKADARNLIQENAESTNIVGDKLKNKNYPVYVILTPDQNWPFNSYMKEQTHKKNGKNYQIDAGYQKQGSSSKTTKSSGTKFKDFSVYVTLTSRQNSRFNPSRREGGPGTSNKFDTANTTGTATYRDNATYVTTVRRKYKSGTSCTRCGKCVTSYMTCSESTDPIQSRSGFSGVLDLRNSSERVTYPAPYTREGRPGPFDVSEANNGQYGRVPNTRPFEINITNSRLITSTPFTREGKPGPFGFCEASNINTTKYTEPVPYTREGRPGPFDISKMNNVIIPKSVTSPAPYTRKTSVPCTREVRLANDISETHKSLTTTTYCTPKNEECGPGRCGVYSVVCVYTSEGTPRHCGLIEVCKSTCSNSCTSSNGRKCQKGNFGTSEIGNNAAYNSVTPSLPYTREGRSELNKIPSTMVATCTPSTQKCGPGRCGVYNVVSVYTSEGIPKHCGLFEICKNTCTNQCTSSNGMKCGHFGTSEMNSSAACNSVTSSLPYTREGRTDPNEIPPTIVAYCTPNTQKCGPGRCGVYNVVSVYTSEGIPRHCGLIEICKNTCTNQCTSSNGMKCGHFGTSEMNSSAACNSVTPCLPYTREGRTEPNEVPPTIVAHCTPNTQKCGPGRCGVYNVVCVYTGEGEPHHCGLIEICKSPCSKPLVSSTHTREGKSRPCGTSEIQIITSSETVTCFLPYTREGKHGSGITEANNIIATKQIGSVPYTREGRPGPFDISEISNNIGSKQITPYTREGKPGPFGIYEKNNMTTTKQIAPVPYTREGRPGPFDISVVSNSTDSKQITPYTREGKPGPCGVFEVNNRTITKQIPYTREGRPGPFDISVVSNSTASKQVTPYTREGKPGPCGVFEVNNRTITKQIPYTREGRPGPFDISVVSNSTASKQVTPYTREAKPGPCGVFEVNNRTITKQIPYTREGRSGPLYISEMSNSTASKQVTPYTREGRPGLCGVFEVNNKTTTEQIAPVPYTREGRPGPFDISVMSNTTTLKQIAPYTREGKPGPFGIFEVNDTTITEQIAPVPYTREGRPGPFDISEMSNSIASKQVKPYTREGKSSKLTESSAPYAREGTSGPCGVFEVNNTTTTKAIHNNIKAPKLTKSSAPYTRESIPRPCGISELSNMNGSIFSYREPCEVYSIMCGYTREGNAGPCCNKKMNEITTPIPITTSIPYTREGKPGPFNISETNIITPCKQCEPIPYTREGRPGPFNIPEMNCCRPHQIEPYIREGKPGPCGILDESNIACPKHHTSCKSCKRNDLQGLYGKAGNITASNQFEPMPYTREGRPGPFDICKMIGDSFKTRDDLTTVATPGVYTREGRPGPFGLSEISNVISNKEILDTTYYNVFMASTNPCQCGFNAPSTQKESSSTATSDKSDQSCIETEYKKHTKNLTYKQGDGTIIDEKRITIIKIKKRKPQKQDALEANKSTCISQNLENETDLECKCIKQSKSENIRSSPDVTPSPKMRTSISTQVLSTGHCDDKKLGDQASNCGCGKEGTPKPSPEPPVGYTNKSKDSASGPKCDCGGGAPSKPPPIGCSNMLKDSASGPKCDCGGGAPPKPSSCACSNKPKDSASEPKGGCGGGASSKPSSCPCSNKLEDSASGPKCKCGDKAPLKPPPLVCANRLEDSASGPKCDCGEKASKPPSLVCANRLEDSASGPKCDCGDKAPKPTPPVCANRLEDSASGPKCDCGEKASKPPSLVCANRLEDSASGPKCDCGDKAPKPPSLVCANRLEDSASGPKCDCGDKAPKDPPLVCANRLEDSASGPKCDCGEKASKPPSLVCANRLEDSASGPKCDCGDKAPKAPKPSPLVCANRLEDSASGPKCDCGEKASKPPSLVCANRLEDSASGPKCDCGGGAPLKPPLKPILICANRLEDSASGPKCDCGGGAPPKPPPFPYPNNPKDSASGPKCDCGGGASPPIPGPHKPKDSASGLKCKCGEGASSKPSSCACSKKPEDSASGPKCDCGGGAPSKKPSSCACSKKPEEATSGPKCDCGGGAPPPIPSPNKPKDSASGPKCKCGDEASSKPSSCACSKKPEDSASGPKCDCGGGAPSKKPSSCACSKKPEGSTSGPKCDCGGGAPPPIPYPNKPKDSASGSKCECGAGGNKPKNSNFSSGQVSGNRVVDLTPKCKCGEGASSKPSSCACSKKPEEAISGPKCDCGGGAPPPVPYPNKPKDSASGTKCKCREGASSKPSSCACSKKPKDSASGPKCDCGGGAPSKRTSFIACPYKLKDSASSPKCDCGGAAPPPISGPNKSKDSVSGPKCECGGGGNKPKNSNSSSGQVSGNRVVDLTPKCKCGGGAPPKPSSCACSNKPEDSASGPKCKCGEGASSKASSCACSNMPEKSASGPKCDCGGGGNKPKNSNSSCGQVSGNRVVDLTPKCECGDNASPKRASKLKDSASDAKCHCVKEPPLFFEKFCPNLSRGSKTSNVSKKSSKTAPVCSCKKEAPPEPKSACGGGAPSNTSGCANKAEETCQTGIPDYPLCACTGEALSKALLQKVLETLRCQNSVSICAPPDKPDRHANCFKEGPSVSNKKKTCGLCGSPLANKETHPPTTKAKSVCSDSSVHAPKNAGSKSKIDKSNKNTTCGYCTFGRVAQNSNKTCEIDNKNNCPCNSTREQNDPVTKFCPSTSTNKKKNDDDSFCTIKIVTKSPKGRCCGTEYKSSLAFTAANTLEALRQLYRSPDHKKINKNICQTCYSPLTPSVGSEIREKPYVLCEFCQDQLVQENERGYRCTTYGVESTSERSPSRSVYSQKTNSCTHCCGNNCKHQ